MMGQIRLPKSCPASKGYCKTREGTWVWLPPTEHQRCRLFGLKDLLGTETLAKVDNKLVTTFVDDDRLVRLEIKEAEFKCNQRIYATNYPNLFLIPQDARASVFKRKPVRGLDVDLSTHFKNQGAWMAGHLEAAIEEYTQAFLEQLCNDRLQEQSQEYAGLAAAQRATMSGATISLKPGQFATPTGEAWHIYECRALQVQGLDDDRCFDSLPIQIAQPDLSRLLRFEGTRLEAERLEKKLDTFSLDGLGFFMEPYSHLITTTGTEMPCVPQFSSYWQSSNGHWMSATPSLRRVTAPEILTAPTAGGPRFTMGNPDFVQGGIYSPRSLMAMTKRRLLPRVKDAVSTEMARGLGQPTFRRPGFGIRRAIGNTWDQMGKKVQEGSDHLNFFAKAYKWIHRWGYVLSFIVGMYTIIRLIGYFLRTTRRCLFPEAQNHHWWTRTYQAILPSLAALTDALCPTFCPRTPVKEPEEELPDHPSGWLEMDEDKVASNFLDLRKQVKQLREELKKQPNPVSKNKRAIQWRRDSIPTANGKDHYENSKESPPPFPPPPPFQFRRDEERTWRSRRTLKEQDPEVRARLERFLPLSAFRGETEDEVVPVPPWQPPEGGYVQMRRAEDDRPREDHPSVTFDPIPLVHEIPRDETTSPSAPPDASVE
jgi:hypothetical protein